MWLYLSILCGLACYGNFRSDDAVDADEDGHDSTVDCDDADPTVNPEAHDVRGDGIDQDCDGEDAAAPDCSELVAYDGDLEIQGQTAALDMISLCGEYNAVDGALSLTYVGSVDYLDCLCDVDGDLVLSGLAATDLAGLGSLSRIDGDLRIEDCDGLTDLSGLDALVEISDSLEISGSVALGSLDGLESLEILEGDVQLSRNGALSDLSALSGLEVIGGGILLQQNAALSDLSGLSGLTATGGDLVIQELPLLQDLSGLEALMSLGGALRITYNESLTDLGGLYGLRSIDGSFLVSNNASLSDAEIDALLSSVGVDNITGEIEINNNAGR